MLLHVLCASHYMINTTPTRNNNRITRRKALALIDCEPGERANNVNGKTRK